MSKNLTPKRGAASKAAKKTALDPEQTAPSSESLPSSTAQPPKVQPAPAPFVDIHADPRPLPQNYGKTLIRLMVRDPEWLFAYWEVNEQDRRRFGIDGDNHGRQMALRVYDLTGPLSEEGEVSSFYDVRLTEYATSWYLHVAAPARSWLVDLGLYDDAGRFQAIARSNQVATPPDRASDVVDEHWMKVDEERFDRVLRASGGERLLEASGSEALGPQAAWQLKPQFFMGASERFLGASEAFASEAAMRRAEEYAPREAPFRLQVGCELIVYGSTEPDADLTIGAEPLALRPDGSFSVRFALPDGDRSIPIKAVKSTGDQSREITVRIAKRTD